MAFQNIESIVDQYCWYHVYNSFTDISSTMTFLAEIEDGLLKRILDEWKLN